MHPIVRYFFSAYPTRTIYALLLLFLSAAVEGLSITAIIPLIAGIMAENNNYQASGIEQNQSVSEGISKFNEIFESIGWVPTTSTLIIIVAVGILTKSFIVYYAKVYVGYTTSKIAKDLRLKLLRAISNVDWNYYVKQPAGAISSSLMPEIAMLSTGYTNSVYFVSCLIQIIIYGIIAIFLSWKLAILVFILSSILIVSLHRLILISKNLGNENNLLIRSILTQLNDSLKNIKSLKAMDCQEHFQEILFHRTKKLARIARHIAHAQAAVTSAQEPIIIITILAGVFVALNWLTIPLEVILVILIVLMRFMKTMGKAQKFYQQITMAGGPFNSVLETITTAEQHRESFSGTINPPSWNAINFNNVTFKHESNTILDSCNCSFKKDTFISIIGASGAGKTTFIDLISGLYVPLQGDILLDEVPLDQINIKAWRKRIGYVTQETTLLHSTIAHNVSLENEDISEDEIINSLKLAEAWSFVESLPEGIYTEVGEQGSAFSGGQRQRILLARAFVRKPDLLILDEVTSALDRETESKIAKVIQKVAKNITVISISHRPTLIELSDEIYELQDGKLTKTEHNINAIKSNYPIPEIISPETNSLIEGSIVSIKWNSNGFSPKNWCITAGTSGSGSMEVFNSGALPVNSSSYNISCLPQDGSVITLSLYALTNGDWKTYDSVSVTVLAESIFQGYEELE